MLARDPNIKITEVALTVVAGNWYGKEFFELLLAKDADIKITEAGLTAAAGNGSEGEVIWLLLARDANIEVLEEILARNSSLRGIFNDVLLRTRQEYIRFTIGYPNSRR